MDAWDRALFAFGTTFIMEDRARRLRAFQRRLNFFGLLGPVLVGSIVLAFGSNAVGLQAILTVAGLIGVAQCCVFLWAIVAKWEDSLAYAVESAQHNASLAKEYEKLARLGTAISDAQLEVLNTQYDFRDAADLKHGITEKEKRKGMRAALRQFRRACSACKQTPTDLSPTDCPVCGSF